MKNNLFATYLIIATLVLVAACQSQTDRGATEQTEITEKSSGHSDKSTTSTEDASPSTNDALADRIGHYLASEYLTAGDQRAIADEQRKFQLYQTDLNGDGQPKVFVNFITSYFCGTGGCTLLLLSPERELITEFTVTRTPLWAEPTTENGWRVLLARSDGELKKLVYRDGTYPPNPSVVEMSADEPSNRAEKILDEEGSNVKTYSF